MPFASPVGLTDRTVISFSGADATTFLQNMMTQDMRRLDKTPLLFSCFLTPQGQILADFFVLKRGEEFLIDIAATQADDFMKRIAIFKLRQKVDMQKTGLHVIAAAEGLADPRHPSLGARVYSEQSAGGRLDDFHDHCVDLGIASRASAVVYGKDVLADMNFDLLGAAAWDKGCFIGQEVAARMYNLHRAKKRIVALESEAGRLCDRQPILCKGETVGEVRQVHSNGRSALAMIRIAHKSDILEINNGSAAKITQAPEA